MVRRPAPASVVGMLILYAGMMLFGQSLHHLLGCEHDAGTPADQAANSVATATVAEAVTSEQAGDHNHDADTCPICQFQAQGQLVSAVAGGELTQPLLTAIVPISTPVVAFFALGVQGPRPPPSV
jgi:hypothetical protein